MNAPMIVIGMIVVFISVFFVIFTYDNLIKDYVDCTSGKEICDSSVNMAFGIGLFIIISFLIVDGGVVYILMSNMNDLF